MGRPALGIAALLLTGCARSVGVVASVPSPDGRHVATAYSQSGRGWLAYCYVCVEVRASGETARETAPCRDNPQRVPCRQGLELKWQGAREVWLGFRGEPREGAPLRRPARNAEGVEVFLAPLDRPRR